MRSVSTDGTSGKAYAPAAKVSISRNIPDHAATPKATTAPAAKKAVAGKENPGRLLTRQRTSHARAPGVKPIACSGDTNRQTTVPTIPAVAIFHSFRVRVDIT